MKKTLLAACLFCATISFAQQQTLNIIPEPAKVEVKEGSFAFNSKIVIIYNDVPSVDIGEEILTL